jgi:hypothetical protein
MNSVRQALARLVPTTMFGADEVTEAPVPTTVWIIDDDLGFVWWLGETFTEAVSRALPALSCDQAISLRQTLNVGIDLLVLNPRLPSSIRTVQILNSAYPNFKTS